MINWIVTSSVLILVVAGLRFVLRGKISLRLQYALWLVVLFRLLVPFDFGESSISMMNVVEQVPMVQEMESLENVESISYYEEDGTVYGNRTFEEDAWPTVAVNQTEADFQRMENELALRDMAEIVWKLGMVVMACAFLFVNFRFKHRLERERKQISVDGCSLPVYVSDTIETPCLFGLIQPAIYVTPEAASDETVLRHTIKHETTHYLQKDHIWSFLRCAVLCLHWYNPLVWWAVKLSKEDGELACDEATIARIGEEERYAYGKTLIEMTKPGRNVLLGTATTMTGSKSALKERIERIAKKPKMAAYTLAAVLVIAVAAVVCTMTGAKDRAFEEWLRDVKDSDICYAQAYSGGGLTQISSILKNDKKEELAAILNGLTEDQIYQEEKADTDTASDYKLLVAEGESDTYEMEVLFHAFEDGTVAVTFDSKTAKTMERRGKTWWIDSMDLAQFIFVQVNSYGTGPIVTADVMNTDVDGDGQGEIINVFTENNLNYTLQISKEDGTVIWEEAAATSHVGWNTLFLYNEGEKSYLLRYHPAVFQGFATYQYYIFTVENGEEVWIEHDSVSFEYSADSTLTPEVGRFLERLNGYLQNSVLLLSTDSHLMGEPESGVVIGPTSSQKAMNHNIELLARMKKAEAGSMNLDAAEAMGTVKAADFVRMTDFSSSLAASLAAAMNHAAPFEITEQAAMARGYDPEQFAYYWTGGLYLEKSSDLWLSNDDLHFELECGLTENIVQVTYGKADHYDVRYFEDAQLYWLIRNYRGGEDNIDEAAYKIYEDVLTEEMEHTFQTMQKSHGIYDDYELCKFYKILEYEEEDGSTVQLYEFDFALLTDTPQHIGWAGGMYLDGKARLRGLYPGQFSVRLQNGQTVSQGFLLNDERYEPVYAEDAEFWENKISEMLDRKLEDTLVAKY